MNARSRDATLAARNAPPPATPGLTIPTASVPAPSGPKPLSPHDADFGRAEANSFRMIVAAWVAICAERKSAIDTAPTPNMRKYAEAFLALGVAHLTHLQRMARAAELIAEGKLGDAVRVARGEQALALSGAGGARR